MGKEELSIGLLLSNRVPSPDRSLTNIFISNGVSDGGPLVSISWIIKCLFSFLSVAWHCALIFHSHARVSIL